METLMKENQVKDLILVRNYIDSHGLAAVGAMLVRNMLPRLKYAIS
jgi:hypothetical protein